MFFNSDYKDLMPDWPEDDRPPEKDGIAGFFSLMGRYCGTLLKANLLFLLGCVPVVTIPVSLFALNRVIRRIMVDEPVKCLQMYGETFRRGWKQSWLAFLVTAVPMGAAGCGAWFYLHYAASNPLIFLPFVVCSTIFLAALLSSGCLYGLLDSGKSFKKACRLALLMGIAKPVRTVPAALCGYGLTLIGVLSFPLSGLYLLLLGWSLPCFWGNFYLRTLLKPFCDEEAE